MSNEKKVSITVLLPAGRLPLELMAEIEKVATEYNLRVYLSTLQNIRLTDVLERDVETVKKTLATVGAEFKGPGKFPLPRVCVGKDHCNLGIIDTEKLSSEILTHFGDRKHTKAKFKIAVAACTMCCSNIKTTDIGIMATRDGLELFVGGKGGPFPKVGRRIGRKMESGEVIASIEKLVEFHDSKTEKKQRMYKLLADAEFPFAEV